MSYNHGSRRRAELDYREIRQEAMTALETELAGLFYFSVHLTHITETALAQASAWRELYVVRGRPDHEPGWDWGKTLKKFRRRPRRVELAIWVDEQLCGLALGHISDAHIVATIHYLEGSPDSHLLAGSVGVIATRYLEVLGVSVGVREVSIERPVPDLIEYYKKLGFRNTVTRGERVLQLKRTIVA